MSDAPVLTRQPRRQAAAPGRDGPGGGLHASRASAALLAMQAQAAREAGDTTRAAALFRSCLDLAPDTLAALLSLGAMRLTEGDAAGALPLLERAAGLAPSMGQVLHAYGLALLARGQAGPALPVLVRARAALPQSSPCALHLAEAALAEGAGAAMLDAFGSLSRRHPGNAALLLGRSALLTGLGRRAEALEALEAASILAPRDAAVATRFADALVRTTRQAEADVALRHALALEPGREDAEMALSVVLMRLHRHAEAVTLLEDLLGRTAHKVGPLCNLSTALTALGRQEEAVARARLAMEMAPAHPAPRRALCNALPYLQGVTGRTLLEAARDCAALHPCLLPALDATTTARGEARRLRVGLVSGTLRAHPVGWLTLAGFEHLDRDAFEILCLSGTAAEDALGRRYAAIASCWEDTAGLDDVALAARARALGLDIAIDLGGTGDLGRLPAFAHRLAPVQVKWVGMQNHSTGMKTMDWFITDRWQTPPEQAGLYSESLLMMPDGYVCYAPPDYAPAVAPAPALARGVVTFGCFNNLAKINGGVIDLWARVLLACAGSRFLLKAHQFNNADTRAALTAAFAARGISSARLELRGSSPHAELLRQYADVDLVLDPFPYSGGLTTVEALWMGVPTLTMPGDTFASRHSAGHMCNVGLDAFVVPDPDAYVDAARGFAADPDALAELRAGLRPRMRDSNLCQAPRFGAALGAALRAAWDVRGAWTPPKILHVSL